MKKLLSLSLAMLLAISMIGCGSSEESSSATSDSQSATSDAPATKVIDIDLTEEEYAFGVDKDQPELLEQVNDFIAKIKEDGTLDEIMDKYFGGGEPTPVVSAEQIGRASCRERV